MKRITISLVLLATLSSQSFAGGDIPSVTEYETVDIINSEEIVVESPEILEPILKEVIAPVIKKVEKEKKKVVSKERSLNWHIGAGLTMGRVSDAHCEDITYGVVGKVGYDFNEYVGVEARGVRTNWEYEGAKIKHVAVFLKPQYPVSEDVNLYGLVGYGKTTTSHKKRVDETGLAYGAGIDYALSENMSMFVDYERLLEKSNVPDLDAVSLGVSFNF